MIRALTGLLVCWLLVVQGQAQAQELRLLPAVERYAVGQYVQVWQDPSAQATALDALDALDQFVPLNADKLTRGTGPSAWWLYLELDHALPHTVEWLLKVDFSSLDYVDVWKVRGTSDAVPLYQGGDQFPFGERPIRHSAYLIPLHLQAQEKTALLLRVQTQGSVIVPLEILSQTAFIEEQESERLLLGGLWGGLLFLMLYNLFLYLNVRDVAYLYYCTYIFTFVLSNMHLAGVGFHYLWPDWLWMQTGGVPVLFMFSAMAANNFSRLLLDLKNRHPLLDRILVGFLVLDGICVVVFPFLPFHLSFLTTAAVVMTMAIVMMAAGLLSFVEGYPPARYYFLAWIMLFIAIVIFALEVLGAVEGSYMSKWGLQVGAAMEALLFAIAISDRINLMKQQTLAAQEKLVEQEKILRTAQEQANRELELRVDQRTRELAKVVEDLARVNEKLDRLNQLDELTHLYNRRAFNQRSVQLLEQCRRESRPLSVLLLDVDHFKQVNDRYGHLVGDECLRRVANLIRERVTRPQDFVARFGGEEFVVVLYDTHLDGALHVAERIRSEVQQMNMRWEDRTIPLTISIGVCGGVPEAWHEVEHFTGCADQALYRAKSEGRNRVVPGELSVVKAARD